MSLRAFRRLTLWAVPLALLIAVSLPRTATAQQPIVVGEVPQQGVAILTTGAEVTPADLIAALNALGCAATSLGITDAGVWQIHVPGAPAFVNASFPTSLAEGRGFVVLCTPSAAAQAFVHLEASGAGSGTATLTDVRTGAHPGFDRFVIEFADEVVPGYQIEYVDTPQFTCGAGFEVTPAGTAWLRVRLEFATISDDQGMLTIPSTTLTPGLPELLEAEEICGFEGEVTWLLGLAEERPFQLTFLSDPARLVIDLPHASTPTMSGVSGLALAGPQCPVEVLGQPCPDLPVDVTLAFSQGATTVATVQTGAAGTFALDLPAGTYTVASTASPFPTLAAQEVTVPASSHAWLELRLDTGIR